MDFFFLSSTPNVSADIVAAIQPIATNILATVAAVAPLGIGVAGAMIAWRKGIAFFRSIAK